MASTRTTYDALVAALERFPAQREAVLRWAAETHTAPNDDIWEYVSAAFLAGGLTADRVEAAVRALPAQVDAVLKKRHPLAAAVTTAGSAPARTHWTSHIAPIAIAIALVAATEFGAWTAGHNQGFSDGYAAATHARHK